VGISTEPIDGIIGASPRTKKRTAGENSMKLGIIGLPGCGKTTIFEALTHTFLKSSHARESRIGTVHVPDERVDFLSDVYMPKKTTYAQVAYFLPGEKDLGPSTKGDHEQWAQIRDCDALIHVLRNFSGFGLPPPTPEADFTRLNQELILLDQMVVEKRLERLDQDRRRGKQTDLEEKKLLQRCRTILEKEQPLRSKPDLAKAVPLRGYAFFSAKPMLVLFNNDDEETDLPNTDLDDKQNLNMVIRGRLEQELAQMNPEEVAEFLEEFGVKASAKDRVIKQSYILQGLQSFFTVGKDEVKAWTIPDSTNALSAAGVIHSDMQKGFIRAEVLAFEDLVAAKSYTEARKRGLVRLEGKTYIVHDGDIITFRFNV
jgi:GTP-binding protein YchF